MVHLPNTSIARFYISRTMKQVLHHASDRGITPKQEEPEHA